MLNSTDQYYLDIAYQQAQQGLKEGGIPIGAILVLDNQIVSQGYNKRIQAQSMTRHAEIDCLENTKRRIPPQDLQRATLFTTLSPCYMCAGCILLNGIPKVVIGENKTFQQSESWLKQHKVEIIIANNPLCIEMMKSFIQTSPTVWGEDIGLTAPEVIKKYSIQSN